MIWLDTRLLLLFPQTSALALRNFVTLVVVSVFLECELNWNQWLYPQECRQPQAKPR